MMTLTDLPKVNVEWSLPRLITMTELENAAQVELRIDEWLYSACRSATTSRAETLALLFPPPIDYSQQSLASWRAQVAAMVPLAPTERYYRIWQAVRAQEVSERIVFIKLITGTFKFKEALEPETIGERTAILTVLYYQEHSNGEVELALGASHGELFATVARLRLLLPGGEAELRFREFVSANFLRKSGPVLCIRTGLNCLVRYNTRSQTSRGIRIIDAEFVGWSDQSVSLVSDI